MTSFSKDLRLKSVRLCAPNIQTTLTNLEDQTCILCEKFDSMTCTVQGIDLAVRIHADRMDVAKKCRETVDELLTGSIPGSTLYGLLSMFFSFVLAEMKSRGVEVIDVKMMWHLTRSSAVLDVFQDALIKLGLHKDDSHTTRRLLALVYLVQSDIEREVDVQSLRKAEHNQYSDCEDQYKSTHHQSSRQIHSEQIVHSTAESRYLTAGNNISHFKRKRDSDESDRLLKCRNWYRFYCSRDRTPTAWHDRKGKEGDPNNSNSGSVGNEEYYTTAELPDDTSADDSGKDSKCDVFEQFIVGDDILQSVEGMIGSMGDERNVKVKNLEDWDVDGDMKGLVQRIMYIVLYALNVGRKGPLLTLF